MHIFKSFFFCFLFEQKEHFVIIIQMASQTLAIDFGTTNSLAGYKKENENIILELDPVLSQAPKKNVRDSRMFRSLLYFPHETQVFYGAEALREYQDNMYEGRLFRSFKSHLSNQAYLGTTVGNRRWPLEEMVGLFLLEIKKRSEKIAGLTFDRAIVGRPAKYSMDAVAHGFAVHRMEKALQFAGFKEWVFVPEPVAAALHVGRQSRSKEKIVLIGDFGGGTSDFTLLRLGVHPFHESDLLAVDGCAVAGDALESSIMKNHLNRHFGAQSKYRLPLGSNVLQMPPSIRDRLNLPSHIVHLQERETFDFIQQILRCALSEIDRAQISQLITLVEQQLIFAFFERIEEAKVALSSQESILFSFQEVGLAIQDSFSKQQFELWSSEVLQKISESLERTLAHAGISAEQVDEVCMTGGTASVAAIQKLFQEKFGAQKMRRTHEYQSVIDGLIEAISLQSFQKSH